MKLENKSGLIMIFLSTMIVLLLSIGFDMQMHRVVLEKELANIGEISEDVAQTLSAIISEKSNIALTMSSAPIIYQSLTQSNTEFSLLIEERRQVEIDRLNRIWMETEDPDSPFILKYIQNPVSKYFKYQQLLFPGFYGELFLTNRYGVMISSTAKLTTLAHRHKYWWDAAYYDGRGRIFYDDRGFDESVEGYVLGLVLPVMENNELAGILKCNINLEGLLVEIFKNYYKNNKGTIRIVRTDGLIVYEKGITPLSTSIDKKELEYLNKEETTYTILNNGKGQLFAASPVERTINSEKYGFGGSYVSIDHIKGNTGQAWHIVITYDQKKAIESTHETSRFLIYAGIIFSIIISGIAFILGAGIAKPLTKLTSTAVEIGQGNLDTRTIVSSDDEIGALGKAINEMAANLQTTMASRNELQNEVIQRKKAEEKLTLLATTDELTGIYNRRAFNNFAEHYIGRSKRYNEPMSLILLDIDHFKHVNDTYGHDMGDKILVSLVMIMKECIRQEDFPCRWGGEEFTILLPKTDSISALNLAERLRKSIEEHDFNIADIITVSIGLTHYKLEDSIDSMIKRADEALYEAKDSGRNTVQHS